MKYSLVGILRLRFWSMNTSMISALQGNCFNADFEAAVAIFVHQDQLIDFLRDHLEQINWYQDGVYQDQQDQSMSASLLALGIIYFWVTKPYWLLLRKLIHYLDFYSYLVLMQSFLTRWVR